MASTDDHNTGEPTQVGAYADRVIIAQRVNGTLQLRDEPADGEGSGYLIESAITVMAELEALVADYTATAERIEDVPMKRTWF